MLLLILILVAGSLLILAIASLEYSQTQAFERNLAKVRDLGLARQDLTNRFVHLDWNQIWGDADQAAGDRALVTKSLVRLEAQLHLFGRDSDGIAAGVKDRLDDFKQIVLRNDTWAGQGPNAELKRGLLELDQGLGRLDSYNAGRLRVSMANQQQQLMLVTGAVLFLLWAAGIAVLRDHHRLNRVKQALRDSESHFHQTFELMPQLVWSCNAKGECNYLSSRWATYTGVPTERCLGNAWLEWIHPDDRDRLLQHWNMEVASDGNFAMEYRIRGRDGDYRWFDARAGLVYDSHGNPFKWLGFCTDIHQRRLLETQPIPNRDQLEAEVEQRTAALVSALDERSVDQQKLQLLNLQLREAEVPMRLVAENIPGYVTYWDSDMRCRFVNQAYSAWLDHGNEAILGRTLAEVHGADFFAQIEPHTVATLAGEAQDFEREEFNGRGELAVIRVQLLPVIRDTRVQGFFILGTNITRHKQAEQLLQLSNAQLAEARDRADSANRAKSNFLANMSHEIRTPMNAIIGLTHILRHDTEDPTNLARLNKIDFVAHHLLQVINDILDLSKIEAGKLSLEKIDFSLEALLTRTCAMVLDVARGKGLEVVLDTSQIPDRLNGDPTRLMQALLNLLGNAVKFTERGSVVLRGELVSRGEASMLVRFEIRDTGVGIDPEVLPRLFTPFAQADDSSTRRHGGTGLGLAITRHIAELMGGAAGCESLPNEGSRFWITVRLAPALQTGAASPPVLNGLRSLVVDDLPEARTATADMLRALGLRAEVAASGEEALAMMAAKSTSIDPYALVLMDWVMPGMDGIETAQRIRASTKSPPPMVLISAHDKDGLQPLAKAAGFGVVLLKPLTPLMLLDGLMHLLNNVARSPPLPLRSVEVLENALREKHQGARVLLVEDNPVNQEVAAELLQAAGLVVDIASDGEQAVRMVMRAPYALVLMDMQMPHMDGLEATRMMRKEPLLENLPIIAMTANAFSEDRLACLKAGMNDHLAKPVDPRVLHETLLRWLPARERRLSPRMARPAQAQTPITAAQRLDGIQGLDLQSTYAQCAGKPELALRVLKQFLAHYRNAGAALMDHLREGEFGEPHRKLHSLVGAAGAVGAVRIKEDVLQLQAAIKANAPMQQVLSLGQILSDDLNALIAELAQRLET